MDKGQVRAWKERWGIVAEVQETEREAQSVARRWRQLNAIVRLARDHAIAPGDDGQAEVWRRWARLKGAS